MARLLAVDECTIGLRNHLLRSLRSLDEAVLLPQAERGEDTGRYKNVVFRLAGNEPHVPIDILRSDWWSGVSAVKIDAAKLRRIIDDPAARATAIAWPSIGRPAISCRTFGTADFIRVPLPAAKIIAPNE